MNKKRLSFPVLTVLGATLLAGCAEFPIFDQKPARTASHPKAVSRGERERDSSPPREAASRPRDRTPDRGNERERDRDEPVASATSDAGLREGVALYNEGDYNGAIKRLAARDVSNGSVPTRLAALKYTAFSYCLTSRPGPCRQTFDKALRIDPSFDLAPGEHGHPLWGPVYTKAKQAAQMR
jgi:hypothetical protein